MKTESIKYYISVILVSTFLFQGTLATISCILSVSTDSAVCSNVSPTLSLYPNTPYCTLSKIWEILKFNSTLCPLGFQVLLNTSNGGFLTVSDESGGPLNISLRPEIRLRPISALGTARLNGGAGFTVYLTSSTVGFERLVIEKFNAGLSKFGGFF